MAACSRPDHDHSAYDVTANAEHIDVGKVALEPVVLGLCISSLAGFIGRRIGLGLVNDMKLV